jgi:hypothetical protein
MGKVNAMTAGELGARLRELDTEERALLKRYGGRCTGEAAERIDQLTAKAQTRFEGAVRECIQAFDDGGRLAFPTEPSNQKAQNLAFLAWQASPALAEILKSEFAAIEPSYTRMTAAEFRAKLEAIKRERDEIEAETPAAEIRDERARLEAKLAALE